MLSVDVKLKRNGFELEAAFTQNSPCLGVFGPSGAGKSTLVHLIAGLERADTGAIRIDGHTLLDRGAGIDVPAHRRRIGVMFQDDRLFPHYSVEGNLRYGERARRNEPKPDHARAHEMDFGSVVAMLGLERLLERRVQTLSGGERQRVALGRTLLSWPRALLMDEPLSSLDHRLRQEILPFLARVRDARTIPMLYVSHELPEILQLTDELLVLDGGRVRAHGRYQSLWHETAALDTLHARGLTNVYRVSVHEQRAESGITVVGLQAGAAGDPTETRPPHVTLAIPYRDSPIGAELQISIQPADIALSLERIVGISIRNQLPGTVSLCTSHDARALVEVDMGQPMIAEVSLGTVEALGIRPGLPMWCLIKSNAIRTLG